MHLRKIQLKNIKSLQELTWALPQNQPAAGWHVVIGDNAAGKSTFMRAVAMALLGHKEIRGLRMNLGEYIALGADEGEIGIRFQFDRDVDRFSGSGTLPNATELECGLTLRRQGAHGYDVEPTQKAATRHIWGTGAGWFSASFGPMRRFSGGDKEYERLFLAQPKLAAHLSIFGEDVALTEIERWLSKLRLQQLENAPQNGGHLLDDLKRFINQPGLLPHGTRWEEVSSEGVFFRDGRGQRVKVDQLSDGFRSILCLALELIRQLEIAYDAPPLAAEGDTIVVQFPGVVLIDEIDAHLHPSWQQEVGFWFTRFFPHMQFIVSTHSPLVCRAAERGSIFRLPSPGQPDEEAGFVGSEPRLRLLRGDVLAAYSTRAFGDITLSPVAQRLTTELAQLSALQFQRKLNVDEQARLNELKTELPLPEVTGATQRRLAELDTLLQEREEG